MSRLTKAELDAVRKDFEGLLSDRGRFWRNNALSELQEGGTFSTADESLVWEGPCSIVPIAARRDRFDEFGEGLIYQLQYRILLPWDADGIRITDRFEVLISDDPEMFNRDFEVRDVHRVSEIGQRRVTVHDIQR